MAFRFTKADRLRKRVDFLTLARSGKNIQNRYYIVFYNPGLTGRSRLGVTVSKKVGKAVIRNRMKRICREVFRNNRHHINGAWDVSVVTKRPAVQLTYRQTEDVLKNLLNCICKDGAA
jgi:ribonuclease P protein component